MAPPLMALKSHSTQQVCGSTHCSPGMLPWITARAAPSTADQSSLQRRESDVARHGLPRKRNFLCAQNVRAFVRTCKRVCARIGGCCAMSRVSFARAGRARVLACACVREVCGWVWMWVKVGLDVGKGGSGCGCACVCGVAEYPVTTITLAGCPTKRAMPRLIRSLINSAYLQHFSDSESLFGPLLFAAVGASC